MPLVARCGSSFLRTVTFLIIHRFLPLKIPLLCICFSKSTAYNTFQFKKMFWIWWKVLDTIILWQDVGPCCEQTHAAFEVGLSPDHRRGVYSGWSDVVVSSQLRLCHTCIIDVMACWVGFYPILWALLRSDHYYCTTVVLLPAIDVWWAFPVKWTYRWMPLDFINEKSILVQVMAWCLMAPSHYLNQCWQVCEVIWHNPGVGPMK